jgi:hypothetical protein
MEKKHGITLIVLVLTACLLLSAALIGGSIWIFKATKNYIAPTQAAASTPPTVATLSPSQPGSTPQPEGLSTDVLNQMDEIQSQVEQIRRLSLKTDLKRDLLTPEQLKDKVVNDFFDGYTAEDAQKDARVLSTLGLLQPGYDLLDLYVNLYTEQIAGYYDSQTKDMYVVSGEGFGGMERMTYAHEFTHALQDQNYDLENGLKLNDDYCKEHTEYCGATSALIEGDATLSEVQWFQQFATRQDYNDYLQAQKDYASPVFDSAPPFMKEDLLFPYSQGYDFVNSLYEQGGWNAVDAAFLNPPTTTEQILHPEKYPAETSIPVDMPDFTSMLGDGWSEYDRNEMGEWYSYLIFAYPVSNSYAVNDEEAKTATAGWGGDTYVYYMNENSQDYLFAWRTTWDTGTDAVDFFNTAQNYGKSRWGIASTQTANSMTWSDTSDGMVTMRLEGSDVLWLMGSSADQVSQAMAKILDVEY